MIILTKRADILERNFKRIKNKSEGVARKFGFENVWFSQFIVNICIFQTRMQSLCCEKQHRLGIYQMLRTMMKEEGLFRPMRGVSAMVAGAGPAHAMYFGCLETGKSLAAKMKIAPHIGDGNIKTIFRNQSKS